MSTTIILIIIFVLFAYFLFIGQYISSLFLALGIIGIFLLGGMNQLEGFLKIDALEAMSSYSFSTVPLYILMAQFLMRTDIISDIYDLISKVSKGRKGPLSTLTIVSGGLLGAVSGSATAATAAIGQVTVPELTKRGFPKHFSAAIAASAGSLSAVIPPSVILIIYGVAAQISIGKLFIATIIPGVITMLSFVLFGLIYLKINSKKLDTVNESDTNVNVPFTKFILPTLMCIFIAISIFGGIFTGIFTPTEAGAVGSGITFLMALIMKKVNKDFIVDSLNETVKITTMAMFIVIGASLFGRFVSLSLLPRKLMAALDPIMGYPTLVVVILLVIYFLLFMIIDSIAVILMTVPVMSPIVTTLNIDPIWFAIMVAISCTIGTITPPVGVNVYVVGSITNISIEKIFKVSMMFAVVATIITFSLLILFPELVTWLPSKMSE